MILNGKKVVFWDVETNGCKYIPVTDSRHVVIQICAITICGCTIVNDFVIPSHRSTNQLIHVPSESVKCHGITPEKLVDTGKPLSDVFSRFIAGMDEYRCGEQVYLVAHNSFSFDSLVLDGFPSWVTHVDSLILFRSSYPSLPKYSRYGRQCYQLGSLYQHFTGDYLCGAHDACIDVKGLIKVCGVILDRDHDILDHRLLPDNTSLDAVRWIGSRRFNKILSKVGCKTVGEMRAYCECPIKTEAIIRDILNTEKYPVMDGQVLELMSVFGHPSDPSKLCGSVTGPLISRLSTPPPGIRSDNELINYYLYDCNESFTKFVEYIGAVSEDFCEIWNKIFPECVTSS